MENISIKLEATYREFILDFSEFNNDWSVFIDKQIAYSNQDIKKVKQYIDKLIKNTFKPIKIVMSGWDSDFEEYTMTSIDSEDSKSAWIVNSKGRRSKENRENLFVSMPKNLEKIKEMKGIDKEIELLKEKNNAIHKSLKQA